jgi:signal transduction histidine kinase
MAQTLAKADDTFAQRQELADRIVERSEALARLVERFELTIDAGMAEKVDMAALAQEVASPYPRVRVMAEGGPFTATLSPVLGRRILGELVANGLEFSPPDAAVTVQVARGRTEMEVRVVDAGPGIDADDRERIFGFLEQVEDLNVRVHPGLGFGLSLARGAARSMGGDVVLESSGPEGSTFLWTIHIEE